MFAVISAASVIKMEMGISSVVKKQTRHGRALWYNTIQEADFSHYKFLKMMLAHKSRARSFMIE